MYKKSDVYADNVPRLMYRLKRCICWPMYRLNDIHDVIVECIERNVMFRLVQIHDVYDAIDTSRNGVTMFAERFR